MYSKVHSPGSTYILNKEILLFFVFLRSKFNLLLRERNWPLLKIRAQINCFLWLLFLISYIILWFVKGCFEVSRMSPITWYSGRDSPSSQKLSWNYCHPKWSCAHSLLQRCSLMLKIFGLFIYAYFSVTSVYLQSHTCCLTRWCNSVPL